MNENREDQICNAIFQNAILFLRRTIKNVNKSTEKGSVSREDAIFLSIHTQFTIEMSVKYFVAKKYGVREILNINKYPNFQEVDLYELFNSNNIYVKTYEILKQKVYLDREQLRIKNFEFKYLDKFQRLRNKILHINYNFTDEEVNELKVSIIYVLARFIIRILGNSEINITRFIENNLDKDEYEKFINHSQYKSELISICSDNNCLVGKCVWCGEELFDIVDKECLLCQSTPEMLFMGFIDCIFCETKGSVAYDKLNFQNFTLGKCLICDEKTNIFKCSKCGSINNYELSTTRSSCTPEYCCYLHKEKQI